MAYGKYFRTNVFGGYKKTDVERYVKSLEETCEKLEVIKEKAAKLEESVASMLESGVLDKESQSEPAAPLRPEWLPEGFTEDDFKLLTEKAAKFDESAKEGLISGISDSELKDRVKDIEPRAWEKAEKILTETEKIAEQNRARAEEALNSELKAAAEQFVTELRFMQSCINTLADAFPERLSQRLDKMKAIEEDTGGGEDK